MGEEEFMKWVKKMSNFKWSVESKLSGKHSCSLIDLALFFFVFFVFFLIKVFSNSRPLLLHLKNLLYSLYEIKWMFFFFFSSLKLWLFKCAFYFGKWLWNSARFYRQYFQLCLNSRVDCSLDPGYDNQYRRKALNSNQMYLA